MSEPKAGRIAYYKAKAKLSQRAFYAVVEDKDKQDLAVEHLARFIHANRMASVLENGQDYSWLLPTDGDVA
jgi:hypothetical protein